MYLMIYGVENYMPVQIDEDRFLCYRYYRIIFLKGNQTRGS